MKIEESTFKETVEIVVDNEVLNEPKVRMYAEGGRLVFTLKCRNKAAAYKICQQLTSHWMQVIKEND